ncbi:MAG: hypothetical protein KGJ15_03400 [Betaproteobacteria bacterium]|nr:hypothetical protein [Betaproteobacteria bacterium]MDE2131791.1 hypothetical protein [Betaproteobacteria bacterium]
MNRNIIWLAAALSCAALAGCSGEKAADTVPQHWQDLDIRVETRPSPPQLGMDEFLVIVTRSHGQPAWDCLVDIRTADEDPWKQAIQDGRVGVYRRSALVGLGERSVVQVQIHRQDNDSTTVLRFPLVNLGGKS